MSRSDPGRLSWALALMLVAFVGHACALQLVDVRPYAAFQHYRPWDSLLNAAPLAVGGIVLQAVIVAALAWRERYWRVRW